jgi:hypothetical protein
MYYSTHSGYGGYGRGSTYRASGAYHRGSSGSSGTKYFVSSEELAVKRNPAAMCERGCMNCTGCRFMKLKF